MSLQSGSETLRALIVDDNQQFHDCLREHLQTRNPGMQIESAWEGAGLAARLDRLRPDVLFLDIKLPDSNGIELARQVHKLHPELPVVVMTAHGEPEYREVAEAAGASYFFRKDELGPQVVDAIMHAAQHERQPSAVSGPDQGRLPSEVAIVKRLKRGSWLAVAMVAVLAAAAPIVLHEDAPGSDASAFHTLATQGSMQQFSRNDLRLVFSGDALQKDLTTLLLAVNGELVGGPSAHGVYTVRIGNGKASEQTLADALARLKADKSVLLAEPALAR